MGFLFPSTTPELVMEWSVAIVSSPIGILLNEVLEKSEISVRQLGEHPSYRTLSSKLLQ